MKLSSITELREVRKELQSRVVHGKTVYICSGTGCLSGKSNEIYEELKKRIDEGALPVTLKKTGCHGLCEKGPVMIVEPGGLFYQKVQLSDIEDIVAETLERDLIVERLLYRDPLSGAFLRQASEIPFYSNQERRVFSQNGWIDPRSLEDYIRSGGYSALVRVLEEHSPEDVIAMVETSGLRGRGGGGYPTGRKWRHCRQVNAGMRYIICNADEGDPGAYMDRSVLEGNPHSVLEGMLIGAWAIGASEGYIYVREEYPLAVENISTAIEDAQEAGLLGNAILGSPLNLNLKVVQGGGAFVCGESTALMKSLEGKRGEPRSKHIHTVECGLNNQPTLLNNVETWANIPHIINIGPESYRQIGTEKSPGTKIFSLVGKVCNTGLIEIPMGMTLRQIIFDLGGGIPHGKAFKAVQTGGPSGGCIPEDHLDTPVDFDELKKLGSMMGSGGMIVMDEDTCMVEVARFYTAFLLEESCGKCVPCREGLWQALTILTGICRGDGREEDLETLETLGKMLSECSLCALGKTAPNPLLSTLRYFREEYLEHIREKKCRAGVCRNLFHYEIDIHLCKGCSLCKNKCPQMAIRGDKKNPHTIVTDLCETCGICYDLCSFGAIRKVAGQ